MLRYRAAEASLYLFYTAEVRGFMLENVFPLVPLIDGAGAWETASEVRQRQLMRSLIAEAEATGRITSADAKALSPVARHDPKEGKKLRRAFAHAVTNGMFDAAEADELMELIQYRNEVAHHIHLVMADITRSYCASEYVAYSIPIYKSDALDRLRSYRRSLFERFEKISLISRSSFDHLLFEHAERVFEEDLVRLDRRIRPQIKFERSRFKALKPELDLSGTELVDDLDPRAPWNFRSSGYEGRKTGHLTPQGVEICYRLFDLSKSALAVAYLMGISLRAARNRERRWREAGGCGRVRAELKRYPGFTRQPDQG
ncbi:hypothetical protein [Sphingomonas sanxanigenens]|uniref:hypothetical protein n=1 Tax=Sphingomonas sanxanigenens TaxID=397260 RepID=UPI00138EE4C7|nr:hypothetical protein [Sphingomonas sanxanigenens]